jgi:Outer membrane protein beta-barrel domain
MTRVAIPTSLATATMAFFAALGPATVTAADTPIPSRRVEVTLFGGYRTGSTFEETTTSTANGITSSTVTTVNLQKGSSFGLALNWEAETDSFYELGYSRQSTTLDASTPFDISIEYLQIGGYTTFAKSSAKVVPYFLVTIGAGRLTPDKPDLSITTSVDESLRAITKFAASIGGGAKVALTPHIALRFDARVYAMFLSSSDNLFCASPNGTGCSVHLQNDALLQPELSLGFTYGF